MVKHSQSAGLFLGINRSGQAVDRFSYEDGTCLVAMAAHRTVGLFHYDENDIQGLRSTLVPSHSDKINGVQFIHRNHKVVGLISISADKTAHVWRPQHDQTEWKHTATLQGHTLGISCMSVVRDAPYHRSSGMDTVATGSDDGTIRIWQLLETDNGMDQGTRLPLAMAMGYLPQSTSLFLLTGSSDHLIRFYVWQHDQFESLVSLPGHTDWIRSIAIAYYTTGLQGWQSGDVMIASGSQDKYIRLWKLSAIQQEAEATKVEKNEEDQGRDILNAFIQAESDQVTQWSTKSYTLQVQVTQGQVIKKQTYSIMLDAMLMGHDDWVHSVQWAPSVTQDDQFVQPVQLVSASADKSIIMWSPDASTGIWTHQGRMGEVGGSTLGYYQATWLNKNTLLGLGYNGAIHIWNQHIQNEEKVWTCRMGLSGHTAPVRDIQWDPTGCFVVSVSLDETSRLYVPWKRQEKISWHELARPQIHGYPLQCLAFMHKYGYVSGADEKIMRIFEAPRTFVKSLENITQVMAAPGDLESRPAGASLPALGLSNKAVDPQNMDSAAHDFSQLADFTQAMSTPTSLTEYLTEPPVEGHLLQHTLWPEVHKLYGHGYELVTVACNREGTLLASAARATQAEYASIRLWSTSTRKQVCPPLKAHSLTVTRLQFSHDQTRLLSASRDRAWALFEIQDGEWTLKHLEEKAHARIIWGCGWMYDDAYFVTGSRDKTLKVWQADSMCMVAQTVFEHSVTAVDVVPFSVPQMGYIMAVGLESGAIQIMQYDPTTQTLHTLFDIPVSECPCLAVNRLAWRPTLPLALAACSDDHSVRIYNINI